MPTPAPCLLVLRAQLDSRWPDRNRASDGIMGDARHRRRTSDHNLGNALDITHDPAHGVDVQRLADEWRRQMAAYPHGRISYLIHCGRIASARTAWLWVRYTGANPHKSHLHLSVVAAKRTVDRPWSF